MLTNKLFSYQVINTRIMKKTYITLFLCILLTFLLASLGMAQTTYKEAQKIVKKDKKALKLARKESKKWEKEGYTNLPGNMPLENQFEKSLVMQQMVTDEGNARYISANGSALAGSEGVAQANALDNTRVTLAGQIQSEVTALISSNKANTGYTAEDVETIDEFVSSSKTLIQNEIGAIDPVIEMMRKVDDKFEYRFIVMYDINSAKMVAKNVIKKELKEKVSQNEAELNKLLGL